MKRILILFLTVCAACSLYAQSLETKTDYTTGYITGTYKPYFVTLDGVLYAANDYDSNWILLKYPANRAATSYEIDSRCNRIARSAFQGARNLQHIYIPTSVKTIGEDAFADCSALQGIYYGSPETVSLQAPTAIPEAADQLEVARYTLDGIKCTPETKGLQIVVYSDFTTKTLLVE